MCSPCANKVIFLKKTKLTILKLCMCVKDRQLCKYNYFLQFYSFQCVHVELVNIHKVQFLCLHPLQVLLLDEPTAELDPFSRHRVWSLLRERREDHVIVFSTHLMEEADLLAGNRLVYLSVKVKKKKVAITRSVCLVPSYQ